MTLLAELNPFSPNVDAQEKALKSARSLRVQTRIPFSNPFPRSRVERPVILAADIENDPDVLLRLIAGRQTRTTAR